MIGNGLTLNSKGSTKFQPLFSILAILLLLATLLVTGTQPARAGGSLVVDMVNEGHDATPGDGICATASGGCSLRAAMEEANAFGGADQIIFGLPGAGVHVISITLGPLPTITDPVSIDGTSQPSCVAPCIVISGASVGGLGNGFSLNTSNSTIKGFIITSWGQSRGIMITGDANTIQTNDIGFWPGNPSLLPNGDGIGIFGSQNTIGGTTAADRNVISGNTSDGIQISNGCCVVNASNVITGNYIGTNAAGTGPLGNHADGITVFTHSDNTSITRNVISSNFGWGIQQAGAIHTRILGNKIGTNAAGTGPLGNRAGGVMLEAGANLNTIGGAAAGQPNLIAYNSGRGVAVVDAASVRNRISRNAIFSNLALGIDLAAAGVTPNDPMDPDAGPNRTQNFPVLRTASSATHVITGALNSLAGRPFTIEFFASPAGGCDPSGYGEGKRFIGSVAVTTNAAGNVLFSYTSPVAFVAGTVITATATDAASDTSEFSRCRPAS